MSEKARVLPVSFNFQIFNTSAFRRPPTYKQSQWYKERSGGRKDIKSILHCDQGELLQRYSLAGTNGGLLKHKT